MPERWDYAARLNGATVGLMTLWRYRNEENSPAGEIGSLYLDPAYQRRGLGTQLLLFGVKELHRRGFRPIRLWALADNLPARRFYEKHGFRPNGSTDKLIIGKPVLSLCYQLD